MPEHKSDLEPTLPEQKSKLESAMPKPKSESTMLKPKSIPEPAIPEPKSDAEPHSMPNLDLGIKVEPEATFDSVPLTKTEFKPEFSTY